MKKILITITLIFLMTTQVFAEAVYKKSTDDVTGEDNSLVSIFRSSGDEMGLAWQCLSDRLHTILLHSYMGGDGNNRVSVLYKFNGKLPSSEYHFSLAENNKVTFFDVDKVNPFIQEALSSNQVVVRIIDPLDNKTLTTAFKLDGLSEALPKLPCVDSIDSFQ